MAKLKDMYANLAGISCSIADGAATSTELLTGISLGTGVGIIIDSIEYTIPENLMTTAGDYVKFGWSTVNTQSAIADYNPDKKNMIHACKVERYDAGTAGNALINRTPLVYNFFPPMIVAAPRLYLVAWGAGFSGTFYSRMYYRYIELTSQEYLELAEAFVLVS